MSSMGKWFVELDGYDWFVKAEEAADGENLVAYCGADGDEAYAKRIVADHNGCLGIEAPETTVPELVAACKACARYFAACGMAWQANDGVLVRDDGRPVTNADGLDGLCDAACDSVHAVLAKTGQKHA